MLSMLPTGMGGTAALRRLQERTPQSGSTGRFVTQPMREMARRRYTRDSVGNASHRSLETA